MADHLPAGGHHGTSPLGNRPCAHGIRSTPRRPLTGLALILPSHRHSRWIHALPALLVAHCPRKVFQVVKLNSWPVLAQRVGQLRCPLGGGQSSDPWRAKAWWWFIGLIWMDVQYPDVSRIHFLSMQPVRCGQLSKDGASRPRRRDDIQRLVLLLGLYGDVHGPFGVALGCS